MVPLEEREQRERLYRRIRDARLKAEDSLVDLSFSLERFNAAINAAQEKLPEKKVTFDA